MTPTVGLVDSGIGGIPYFRAARRALPEARFLYLADTKNFPYGEKSGEEVLHFISDAVALLAGQEELDAVVVACNTASVLALDALRARFPFPFVGVVPAVKPAAASSREGRIGVLATPRTAEGPYLSALISRFAADAEVVVEAAPNLVEFVEHELAGASPERRREVLGDSVRRLVDAEVDQIVLGCTHFVHLREDILRLSAEGVGVVDSVEGVTRQLLRVLGRESREKGAGDGASPRRLESSRARLYVTSESRAPTQYRSLARAEGMEYAGEISR